MKSSVWRLGLSTFLLLFLAGCFQQAGESLQSTSGTAEPIGDIPTIEAVLSTEEVEDGPQAVEETPELAATPTSLTEPTDPPALTGPGTPTLPPITIIFQPTDAPRTPEPDVVDTAAETTEEAVGFITPGIPLGPDLTDPTEISAPNTSGALSTTPSGLITPTMLPQQADVDPSCTYTVESGDTVYRIALANDTSVAAMQEVNPELEGENPLIQPGQVLVLPDCDGSEVSDDDEVDDETVQTGTTATSTRVPPIIEPSSPGTSTSTPVGSPDSDGDGERYVVQPGDTLLIIAQRFGTTIAAITAANEIANPNRLSIGQELIIPNQP